MTYKQFLNELKERLKRLPAKDREEALRYYEEYFAEAGPSREEEVMRELRSPAHVASKILSDYAVKESSNTKKAACGNFRAVWFIMLGIFAAPIALPAAIFLTVVIILMLLILFAAVIAVVAGCVGLLFVGLPLLFIDIGSSFIILGILILGGVFIWGIACALKAVIRGISCFIRKI